MPSYLPDAVDASRISGSPDGGTPAGTVVVRSADLRVRGGRTVTAGGAMPSAGELAVFCRPVVTAPALVRRDGSLAADGWLPDFVRLGELERHLGDGVIEAIAGVALEAGRLNGCTPSTSPDGSATPSAPRKHARNSRTPPQPR